MRFVIFLALGLFLINCLGFTTAQTCEGYPDCSNCDDALTTPDIGGCIEDGLCSGRKYKTSCGNDNPTDCRDGWPVNRNAGGCWWPGDDQRECAECAPGYEDKRGCVKAECKVWGIPVWGTCETEQRCSPCKPGYAAPNAGAMVCSECPAGKQSYPEFISSTELSNRVGSLSPTDNARLMGASKECKSCPAGRFGEKAGEMLCDSCKGNTYTGTSGKTACDYCPAGKQAENWDYNLLDPEDISAYYDAPDNSDGTKPDLPGTGSTKCVKCEAGKFSSWVDDDGDESGTSKKVGCKSCMVSSQYGKMGAEGWTSDAGASSCYECPAGKHANKTLNGLCELCIPGRYQNTKGGGVVPNVGPGCSPCDRYGSEVLGDTNPQRTGYISNVTGATDCIACPAGKFKEDNKCKLCEAGKYSEGAYTTCSLCVAGKSSSRGAASCYDCKPGRYSNEIGSPTCTNCTVGKYASEAGRIACLDCPLNKIQTEEGMPYCDWCDAGKYEESITTNSCTACGDGKYREEDDIHACVSCSLSSKYGKGYVNGGSSGLTDADCAAIGAPSGCWTNKGVCHPCPAGKSGWNYLDNSGSATNYYNSCYDCKDGTHSGQGATMCSYCQPGEEPISGQSDVAGVSCIACAAGKAGTGTCEDCPVGKKEDDPGSALCDPCGPGTETTAEGFTSCTPCRDGKYTTTGGEACKDCEAGYVPNSGATLCTPCLGGEWSAAGSATCTKCTAGKYAPNFGINTAATACLECPAGKYSEEGASSCDDCPRGEYSDSSNSPSCTTCAAGKMTAESGQTKCYECDVGKYSRFTTSPTQLYPGCDDCDSGKYAESVGKATCDTCLKGKYSKSGQASCTLCEEGKHQPEDGQSDCDSCIDLPNGAWGQSSPPGAIDCVPCEVGKQRNIGDDNIQCEECPAGEIVTKLSSGKRVGCQKCVEGKYKNAPLDETCASCNAGTQFAVEGSSQGCINFPTDFTMCPQGEDGSVNKCQYWFEGKMKEVDEAQNSPFLSTCSSLSMCSHVSVSSSGSLSNTFYNYCNSCAAGYTQYVVLETYIAEGSIVPSDDTKDESCRDALNGMPSLCYKPTDFHYCPDGAVCNYLHQNARVTKQGGEESPFGRGCAGYTVCNIDTTQSAPTYDLKCNACNAAFTEVLKVSGSFGGIGDDFGGSNNGAARCTGSHTSVCLNVTSWDTCPAELAGVGGGRRKLRGAENPWTPLDFSWKGLHGGLDLEEEEATDERRLTCESGCQVCCPLNMCRASSDTRSCDCDACSTITPITVPTPSPVPVPTPSPVPVPPPSPVAPTPTPPPGTAPSVSCNYVVNNYEQSVEPGQSAPISNCADFTMCDNSDGKLTLQCTKCKDGYRGCNFATGNYGTCSVGSNPTNCITATDRTYHNWKACPVPSSSSCPSSIKCDYLTEYGFRENVNSPFVVTSVTGIKTDTCAKYKICSYDVTNEETDTYKLMCEQCANGYVPSKLNTEVWGDCNEIEQYATKCVVAPQPTAAPAPGTVPTQAPVPAVDPPTAAPTKAPTIADDASFIKENLGLVVGGGSVGFIALCILVARMVNFNTRDDHGDDDDDSPRHSVGAKIELSNFDGKKRRESGFEVTSNPMGEPDKMRKKKKKKEKEKRVSVGGDGLLSVVPEGEGKKKKKKKKEKRVSVGEDGLLSAAPPAPPSRSRPRWQKFTDPNSGNPYWFNVDTNQTTWDDPGV